jgi:hypothetical protein
MALLAHWVPRRSSIRRLVGGDGDGAVIRDRTSARHCHVNRARLGEVPNAESLS